MKPDITHKLLSYNITAKEDTLEPTVLQALGLYEDPTTTEEISWTEFTNTYLDILKRTYQEDDSKQRSKGLEILITSFLRITTMELSHNSDIRENVAQELQVAPKHAILEENSLSPDEEIEILRVICLNTEDEEFPPIIKILKTLNVKDNIELLGILSTLTSVVYDKIFSKQVTYSQFKIGLLSYTSLQENRIPFSKKIKAELENEVGQITANHSALLDKFQHQEEPITGTVFSRIQDVFFKNNLLPELIKSLIENDDPNDALILLELFSDTTFNNELVEETEEYSIPQLSPGIILTHRIILELSKLYPNNNNFLNVLEKLRSSMSDSFVGFIDTYIQYMVNNNELDADQVFDTIPDLLPLLGGASEKIKLVYIDKIKAELSENDIISKLKIIKNILSFHRYNEKITGLRTLTAGIEQCLSEVISNEIERDIVTLIEKTSQAAETLPELLGSSLSIYEFKVYLQKQRLEHSQTGDIIFSVDISNSYELISAKILFELFKQRNGRKAFRRILREIDNNELKAAFKKIDKQTTQFNK